MQMPADTNLGECFIQLGEKQLNSPMVLEIPGLFSSPYSIDIHYFYLLSCPKSRGSNGEYVRSLGCVEVAGCHVKVFA